MKVRLMGVAGDDRVSICRRRLVAGLAAVTALSPRYAVARPVIRVAAADHLSRVLPVIVAEYARATGRVVSVTFGRAELLVRRIGLGEQFDLFLGVGEDPIVRLRAERRTVGGGAIYAFGKLAVATLREYAVVVDSLLDGLKAATKDGRLHRLIVPDPSALRIGAVVAGALAATGLQSMLRPDQVVNCGSVVETLQRLLDGEGEAAIVAHQTVLRLRVTERLRFAIVEPSLHAPLPQLMALLVDHEPGARAFYDYLLEPAAQRGFAVYGFTPVSEAI